MNGKREELSWLKMKEEDKRRSLTMLKVEMSLKML
jgi:hypothetical protein